VEEEKIDLIAFITKEEECSICHAKIPAIVGLDRIKADKINFYYNCDVKFNKK